MTMTSGRAALTSRTPRSVTLSPHPAHPGPVQKSRSWRERHAGIVCREEHDQRSSAVKRLFGCPVERLASVFLAVVADDDGHLADRTVQAAVWGGDSRPRRKACNLLPGESSPGWTRTNNFD